MTTRFRWGWIGAVIVGMGCSPETSDGPPAACDADVLEDCAYPSPELTFTESTVRLTDAETGRELPVLLRVPEGDGPFQVVLYSHGGGLNDNGHTFGAEWGKALAAHGYITGTIGHVTLEPADAAVFCELGEVPEDECDASAVGEDSGMVALLKRRDVIGVLDALPALAASEAAADGPEVDLDHVAVIGWSAGSRATMAARGAGFLPTASAPVYSESDPRIDAIVAFSPTGPGFGGFFDDDGTSWDTLDGPTLMATGENDKKTDNPELTGAIRRQAYELQPDDGERRLLYSNLPVDTGRHGTYNLEDLESDEDVLVRFSLALRGVVRAFLDHTLRADPEALAWLDSEDPRVLAGDADWEAK